MGALLPMLLFAATPLSPADETAIGVTVRDIYRPYSRDGADTPPWDYPIYSAETKALIAHWQRVVPNDEPDDLNDGDWLCMCQDWDSQAFKPTVGAQRLVAKGVVDVDVRIDLGFGEDRAARLRFKKEDGRWRLDDLFAETFPTGLKQALRETIAKDEGRK